MDATTCAVTVAAVGTLSSSSSTVPISNATK
jgi:hypothetical protein